MEIEPAPPIRTAVLDEFRSLIGESNTLTAPHDLERFDRDISPWRTIAGVVLLPDTASQVSEIVKIANREHLAVWAFSRGKNWGYGATMALSSGAVVLVLERMNRILEVNVELAYAVIEPGVSQGQLRRRLDDTKSGLWTDCTDSTPDGSVIGNALEHGIGYTPYADHFGSLCGMEVVLGDGSIIRLGGGPENAHVWNTLKWGSGPYLDGVFTQSNFGIVTKVGVWLMPAPPTFNIVALQVKNPDSMPAVIDRVRKLSLQRILQTNVHIVNDVLFSAIISQYPYDLVRSGEACLSSENLAALRKRLAVSPWTMTTGVYGTPYDVGRLSRRLRVEFSSFGRVLVIGRFTVTIVNRLLAFWAKLRAGSIGDRVLRFVTQSSYLMLRGIPALFDMLQGKPGEFILGFAYFKMQSRPEKDLNPARDGCGMIWVPVALPLTGAHAETVRSIAEGLYREHGFDYSNVFMMVNSRTTLSLMQIWFKPEDTSEKARALALQRSLALALKKSGYQQYRSGLALYGDALSVETSFVQLANRLKRALDPNNVLAPGRYGLGSDQQDIGKKTPV